MTPSKNMSRQKTAAISLLAWFAPFAPLFFIFGHDLSERHLPALGSSLVFLPGAAIWFLQAWVSGSHVQIPEWLAWCSGILMPAGFVIATLVAARWRLPILVAGVLAASGLSWFAYILMRA